MGPALNGLMEKKELDLPSVSYKKPLRPQVVKAVKVKKPVKRDS